MEDLDETALNIYTDGSCYSSPRVGGIGFLFITVDDAGEAEVHEECPPGWLGATNNQMELQACIEALKITTSSLAPVDPARYRKIVIRTDSMYVAENFDRAKYEWSRNGWKTRDGAPVANTQQWRELMKLLRRLDRDGKRVEVKWVKGHRKDPHNRRVDKLAKQSAKGPGKKPLRPVRVRRKKSPNKVQPGCIRMRGQVETVHIIVDEYQPPPHDSYRYMYEVVDEDSPDFQLVDKVTSDLMLGAGHTYSVRFNEDQRNPRIEEVLAEIDTKSKDEDEDEDEAE